MSSTLLPHLYPSTNLSLSLSLLLSTYSHRNSQVRRTAAQFLSQAVERYGPPQLLHASRDILEKALIATLGFVGDATADPRCNTILNIASYNMPQSNFRPNGNTPAALSPILWF